MSEKELYDDAKKRLCKRFYFNYIGFLIITIAIFALGLTALIIRWEYENHNTRLIVVFIVAILLFLSFFLIGLLISGTMKLKKNDIKKIIGTVVDVKRTGNADGSTWYYPIVNTTTGKTIKLRGITDDFDDFEIGKKYQFLVLHGVQIIMGPAPVEERPKRITGL